MTAADSRACGLRNTIVQNYPNFEREKIHKTVTKTHISKIELEENKIMFKKGRVHYGSSTWIDLVKFDKLEGMVQLYVYIHTYMQGLQKLDNNTLGVWILCPSNCYYTFNHPPSACPSEINASFLYVIVCFRLCLSFCLHPI